MFKFATFANFKALFFANRDQKIFTCRTTNQDPVFPRKFSISQALICLKTWGTLSLDIKILQKAVLTKFEHSCLLIKARRKKQSTTQLQQ